MPEGPEVYILAKVFKSIGFESDSIGKHLILRDAHTGELFDFSFGLGGKIKVEDNLSVSKINHRTLPSGYKLKVQKKKEVEDKLGVDWMKATKEEIEYIVKGWVKRKKQVGALILDQSEIAGIGVVWASEILHRAKIQPELKANLIEFLDLKDNLVDAIYEIGKRIKKVYLNSVEKDEKKFINSWFHNLYQIREKELKVSWLLLSRSVVKFLNCPISGGMDVSRLL